MSEPEFHRDRREHGGASQYLDDDKLAEITEDERVEAGLDDFNPDEVPPATDPLPPGVPEPQADVRQSAVYQEERAEVRREEEAGELRELTPDNPFPPTRYDERVTWERRDRPLWTVMSDTPSSVRGVPRTGSARSRRGATRAPPSLVRRARSGCSRSPTRWTRGTRPAGPCPHGRADPRLR